METHLSLQHVVRFCRGVVLGVAFVLVPSTVLAQAVATSAPAVDSIITVELWHKPTLPLKPSTKPALPESHKLPRAGEPLWVKITLRNLGKTTLRVMELDEAGDFQLAVYGKDNQPIPLTALGTLIEQHKDEGGSRATNWIAPGASTAKCIQVNALFDMSIYGSYKIVASRRLRRSENDLVTSQPFPVTLDYASIKLRPGVDAEAPDASYKPQLYDRPHPQGAKGKH